MTTELKQELIERFGLKFLRSTKYNEIWKGDDTVMIWNRTNGSIKIKPVYGFDVYEERENVLNY